MFYVFIYSVVAAVVAAGLVAAGGRPDKSGASAIGSFLAAFVLLLIGRWIGQPLFTHFLGGGHLWFWLTAVIIAAISASFISEGEGGVLGFSAGAVVVVILFAVVANQVIPPGFCRVEGHRRLANLWTLEESDAPLHAQEIDPEMKVQVSPEMALLRARNSMPGDIGSYLEVAPTTALQLYQGHPYYVVGMRVRSGQWSAFVRNGSLIPGYFLIDALDKEAGAKLVTGYNMKYVDSDRLFFRYELDRYAYYQYFQNHPYRYDDLMSLELDEEGNPYYSATLLRHEVGNTGDVVAGAVTFDPQTGEIKEYNTEEIPGWMDDVWTHNIFQQYADWWGRWAYGAVCNPFNESGKRKIDTITDVFTSDGELWYQVTMTSMGNDTALTDVIYGNPTNGQAFRYDVSGKGFPTIKFVDETMFEQASLRINPKGFEAVEVELDWINGEWVYYGILLGRDNDNNTTGAFNGFAFVRASDAAAGDVNSVVIETEIEEALRLLRTEQRARRPDISATNVKEQFRGTVQRVYPLDYGDNVVIRMVIETMPITPTTEMTGTETFTPTLIPLQAGALDQDGVASHVIVGDEVIVTASKGETDEWYTIEQMEIVGDPVFGRKED